MLCQASPTMDHGNATYSLMGPLEEVVKHEIGWPSKVGIVVLFVNLGLPNLSSVFQP